MFLERGALLADGKIAPFQHVPSTLEISRHGGEVVSDPSECYLLDDAFYLSGEIPRVTSFEKGRVDHMCRENSTTAWRPDPLLMDERYLVANVRDKGLVVFSSCSHAGVINVLENVRTVFGAVPIFCVFGGLHLVGSLEAIIPDTVAALKTFNPTHVVPAHCSGFRATNALINGFGMDAVQPSAVGNKYTF
jgi:7,8-dihydropterin-6-yl-methyl-4-(beta-D-ribofuranosyl)aminobenzene 5'-phosphate synthase